MRRGAMQSAQTLARLTGEERHDRWVVALALSVRDRNAALQALTRLESNGTITLEDRRLWADLLEQLGDPDTAIARIQSWQAAGIRDQALAIRAATWLEQTGRLDEADEAWTAITAQYGAQPAFVQAQSNVLAQNWQLDSAFDVLANAPSTPQDAATGYWQQRAALAWQLGDSAASLEAYTALFEQGALDADGTSRLIQTAADQQQLDLAMRVSEKALDTSERWRCLNPNAVPRPA